MTGNPLVPYLIRHGLAGMFGGWLTAAFLLGWDVAGVGRLVLTSDLFPVPLIMLLTSFGLTFASCAMAPRSWAWGGPSRENPRQRGEWHHKIGNASWHRSSRDIHQPLVGGDQAGERRRNSTLVASFAQQILGRRMRRPWVGARIEDCFRISRCSRQPS